MTWRDFIKVHPAAALFPPLPTNELIQLEQSVREYGLQNKAKLWRDQTDQLWLIDGTTRLDIIERIHQPSTQEEWLQYAEIDEVPETEKELVHRVLAANIMRRHLTAAQRADLAVQVLKTELQKMQFRKDAYPVVQKAAGVGIVYAQHAVAKELGVRERTPTTVIDEIVATTGKARGTVKNILSKSTQTCSQSTVAEVEKMKKVTITNSVKITKKPAKQIVQSAIYPRDEQFVAAALKLAEKPDYAYTDHEIGELITIHRDMNRFLRCVAMLPWLKIQRDRSGTKFTVDHDLRNFCDANRPGTIACDSLAERLERMWAHIITVRREQKMEAERARWYPGDIEVAELRLLFDYIDNQLREMHQMVVMPKVPRKSTSTPTNNSQNTSSDVALFNQPTKEIQ